jgi:Ser/Thr protein kinase RdoA (MazF antagonist)
VTPSSYLSQVRRLRRLAVEALGHFQVSSGNLHFINHGENTTFRFDSSNGRRYLLRIHRDDYHTRSAILEELAWLRLLAANRAVTTPRPILSRRRRLVESVELDGLRRHCCMFEWIDGRFIGRGVKPAHLYKVGRMIAQLQHQVPRAPVRHRRYWHAEGLVGRNAKFGPADAITGVSGRDQSVITQARKLVLGRLKRFEKKFPRRMGLIKADLHFGNLLWRGDSICAIDFDDCGFGFHAYVLVVPMIAIESMLGAGRLEEFRAALIEGYSTLAPWDANDEGVYRDLRTARRIGMLGWLNSRAADNAKFRSHLKGAVARALAHVKAEYDLG